MPAAEKAVIASPNFPDRYPYNADCLWRFSIPANKFAHVIVPSFSLEKKHTLKVVGVEETKIKVGNETHKNVTKGEIKGVRQMVLGVLRFEFLD